MTDEEVQAYLLEQTVLNVATIGPSGHPHVVAMWYVVLDGQIAFWTFGKSQKIVNLRRDPKMTGLVESGDVYAELRGVELVGTGRIIDDVEQILHIGVQVALKYNGAAAISDAAMPFIEAQARKRLGVVLEVEQIDQLGSHQARWHLLTRDASPIGRSGAFRRYPGRQHDWNSAPAGGATSTPTTGSTRPGNICPPRTDRPRIRSPAGAHPYRIRRTRRSR